MLLIDFHVHFYPVFDPKGFLDDAARNLLRAAGGDRRETTGVLVLLESSGTADLIRVLEKDPPGRGTLRTTAEPGSFRWETAELRLFLIPGRQVNTAERLEMASIGSPAPIEEGLSLRETVRSIRAAGGIPVLPWGAGKWSGERGRILRRFLEQEEEPVFPGDNGGRPIGWPTPSVFRDARRNRIPLLPGSDPLPLPGEERRVGSFGGRISGRLSDATPAADLKNLLLEHPAAGVFGRRISPWTFLRLQIRLRKSRPS